MASGRMYNSDDMVEEYLINQIAKYVQYDKLGRLSGDLGIKSNDFQRLLLQIRSTRMIRYVR